MNVILFIIKIKGIGASLTLANRGAGTGSTDDVETLAPVRLIALL